MTTPHSRRRFLAAGAALSSSALAQTLQSALATPAARRTGTLADIGHIVFLMQENRSFDHYFGTLAGVRGFNDPRAIRLPSAKPVWHQPYGASEVLPYHFDVRGTNALRIGLNHSWKGSEATWKDWAAWPAQKSPRCMGFFDRQDLPFYYALADAFTVCDAYYSSVFGPTDPNRFYALSGHAGGVMTGISDSRLYNVNNGTYNADIANDHPSAPGIAWSSYAEQLEALGVSWKVYQEWDNYGDNYLQYFQRFRFDAQGRRLTPDSPYYRKGRAMSPGSTAANAAGTSGQWLIDDFRADLRAGRLPAVSWICAPTEYCEHPAETPNAGEHFTARLLAALADHPETWARTVLVLSYDENDGFFDHCPVPMAPRDANQGRSSYPNTGELYQGREPIGLGPRVPALVLSPWSKGGRVNSQLFDHTSQIRLLEEWLVQGQGLPRAAVQCPHISPWRRALCGDLTSTLNLSRPDDPWPSSVPRSAVYFKGWGSADALPPAVQTLPGQERRANARPACALPYRVAVQGAIQGDAKQFALDFINNGTAAAAFIVYSGLRSDGPWHYSVAPAQRIDQEVWNWGGGEYHLAVQGPNGFAREFWGRLGAGTPRVEVSLSEQPQAQGVQLLLRNLGASAQRVQLRDLAYGDRSVQTLDLAPGQQRTLARSLLTSQGWYDIGLRLEGDPRWWRRLSGHLEGAGLDASDPVLSGLAQAEASPWPAPANGPAPVQFTASTALTRVGDSVQLQWRELPAGSKHWLGVYRKGQTPGVQGALRWNYVAAPAGSQALAGLAEGEYFIGLFLNDGYAPAAAYLPLRVLRRGDVNGDTRIDAADREAQRVALGSCAGQPRYQPLADFDGDACITQADYRAWYELFTKEARP